MIHPRTTIGHAGSSKGLGVFATAWIPKGSVVFVQDTMDKVIPSNSQLLDDPCYVGYIRKYSYIDQWGNRILSWDHAKYMNHHCQANILSTGWGFDIAVEDIFPGTELTCDYGLLNLERSMKCACGSPLCRRVVHLDDPDRMIRIWDMRIREALYDIYWPMEPLAGWVPKRARKEVDRFLDTGTGYRSCRVLRYISGSYLLR